MTLRMARSRWVSPLNTTVMTDMRGFPGPPVPLRSMRRISSSRFNDQSSFPPLGTFLAFEKILPRGMSTFQDILVERGVAVCLKINIEFPLRFLPGAAAQSAVSFGVFDHPGNATGQIRHVKWRRQLAVPSMLDHIRHPTGTEGDTGRPAGDRFQDGVGEIILDRRRDKDVRCRIGKGQGDVIV